MSKQNPIRRISGYVKPYLKESILSILLLSAVVFMDLMIPRLVQVLIDEGVYKADMAVITRTSLLMVGASLLSAFFMIMNTVFAVRTSRGFEADVREALFRKIQSFSFGNLDDFRTGELITRLTSDLNQLQMMVLMSLRMFIRAPLMFFGSIWIMVNTNFQLARIMLALLPITGVFVILFVRVLQPLFMRIQKKLENLNQVLQENLAGVRVVKAFVRQDYENRRFNEANTELMKESVWMSKLGGVMFPIMMLIMNLGTAGIIYYGGLQTIEGVTTVGEIMAFVNYIFMTSFPILMLAMMAGQVGASNASAKRILQVLDSEPDVQSKPDAVTLDPMVGRVEFRDVMFSYDNDGGEPVLSNINLVAEPGQTVALLGSTGSGKTSLVHLIPRFYDVTGGSVSIDGVDVRDLDQKLLRRSIGVSLQEPVLFSGTVRDNIRYGHPEASDEDVVEAAKAAQAHGFISGFPAGYDTEIGQRGVNLSGGQKQRIAIARALLLKPRILILDDSTSSVDVETEILIEEALDELMKQSTSFVIAQRISTVLNADKIVVLDNGRVAAEGTHSELMAGSPIYQEIYDSQLGGGVFQ